MRLFPWQRRSEFFTSDESEKIVQAIRDAEMQTSGEIRLYVESRCKYVDPMDRAGEIFFGLKMDQTKDRNGVLVYIALRDRQLAVFGDEGIHREVGAEFWAKEVRHMISEFKADNYADAIAKVIADIGQALKTHFPYEGDKDKNELPDDIVFGH